MRLRPGSVLMMSVPVCRASAVSAISSVVAVMAIGESAARATIGAASASIAAMMRLVAGLAFWRDNPPLAIATPPCTDQRGDVRNVLGRVAGQPNHAGKGP